MDATANPRAPSYYNFDTSTMATSVKADIGYVAGQINIYYVRSLVWGGVQYTNAGEATFVGGPSIAIASNTLTTVLAHEIGHLCALSHVGNGPTPTEWFDYTNLMTTYGTLNMHYLTEGQILRMHLTSTSVLNTIYHARPGQLTRDCNTISTTRDKHLPGCSKEDMG